jgi:hypothetical protein
MNEPPDLGAAEMRKRNMNHLSNNQHLTFVFICFLPKRGKGKLPPGGRGIGLLGGTNRIASGTADANYENRTDGQRAQ